MRARHGRTMRSFAQGLEVRTDGTIGPKIVPGPTEHEIQVEFFEALDLNAHLVPQFAFVYAVANSGAGAQSGRAGWLKAEGVRAGVPDVEVPYTRHGFVSLRIEFKRPGGSEDDDQVHWRNELTDNGHLCVVRTSAIEAFELLLWYFGVDFAARSRLHLPGQWTGHRPRLMLKPQPPSEA